MRGFSGARLGALVLFFAFIFSGCALFKTSILKDLEVDCGEPALVAATAVIFPDVLAWAEGQQVNWLAGLSGLEVTGKSAVLCAAATALQDLDPNGVTLPATPDAGPTTVTTPTAAALAVRSTQPLSKNLVLAQNLRTYLAAHAERPVVAHR